MGSGCIGTIVRLAIVLGLLSACSQDDANPVTAAGAGDEIAVMDFTEPFPLDPPPDGWRHRTFWTRPAMQIAFAEKDGVKALRCETDGSGSIFGRNADVALADYPLLTWRWYVELPIDSDLDEATEAGDDHPARLFIRIDDSAGEERYLEIIWSNRKYAPGDYKYIGDFPHYVANGHDENAGRWHDEQVDLLAIYRTITDRDDAPRVKLIAIFCDSDDTDSRSIAYFADVRLRRGG